VAVAFGLGIAAWFVLPGPWNWLTLVSACLAMAACCAALFPPSASWPYLRQAGIVLPLALLAGCLVVWARSELVGTRPIARPEVAILAGKVISVEEQPALQRTRMVLATRDPDSARPIRVRINVPDKFALTMPRAGSLVRVRARLMPPAPPMLPGGYDFARTAWFSGLAATGSALAPPQVDHPAIGGAGLAGLRSWLSRHAMAHLPDSRGGIAAALLTGDHGGIADIDAQAMRDAGLAHLLSISGLHVSAVIAAAYLISLRLLALWPWLALRLRLPVVAAAISAAAGIGYTVLTGGEVPTVRSCIGALLVLVAIALGREALSLRLLAIAALAVMLAWPESVMGPSFQMSFGAVLAIIALGASEPVRRWLAPREEGWLARIGRHLAMLLVTGFVIELALMPIGFFHFHRAGAYGALANVIAIPLTTILIMPLVAIAALLEPMHLGAPLWWLAGKAIGVLLTLAHSIAGLPGAVTVLPAMGGGAFLMFLIGGLWLGLMKGRARMLGLLPAMVGVTLLIALRPPDLLVSGDGRHVGIVVDGSRSLAVLRGSKSGFASDNLKEMAGLDDEPVALDQLRGSHCSEDFCTVALPRGDRQWQLLMSRSDTAVPERSLAAACALSDIVVSDRWLPSSCRPKWLKIDRHMLQRTGGITIDLSDRRVDTVAARQGLHGWWRGSAPPQAQRQSSRTRPTPALSKMGWKSGQVEPVPDQ